RAPLSRRRPPGAGRPRRALPEVLRPAQLGGLAEEDAARVPEGGEERMNAVASTSSPSPSRNGRLAERGGRVPPRRLPQPSRPRTDFAAASEAEETATQVGPRATRGLSLGERPSALDRQQKDGDRPGTGPLQSLKRRESVSASAWVSPRRSSDAPTSGRRCAA